MQHHADWLGLVSWRSTVSPRQRRYRCCIADNAARAQFRSSSSSSLAHRASWQTVVFTESAVLAVIDVELCSSASDPLQRRVKNKPAHPPKDATKVARKAFYSRLLRRQPRSRRPSQLHAEIKCLSGPRYHSQHSVHGASRVALNAHLALRVRKVLRSQIAMA